MGPELATGLFTLGGVIVGAGASTWGQVYVETKRAKHEADRAKRLVAGELLHLQLVLRAAAVRHEWPPVSDVSAHVPNTAWKEFRSRLVDTVDDDLFNQLVMTYAELEVTRQRFVTGFALVDKSMAASDATSLMHMSYRLGRLRRRLADTGVGWPDEIVEETVDSFSNEFAVQPATHLILHVRRPYNAGPLEQPVNPRESAVATLDVNLLCQLERHRGRTQRDPSDRDPLRDGDASQNACTKYCARVPPRAPRPTARRRAKRNLEQSQTPVLVRTTHGEPNPDLLLGCHPLYQPVERLISIGEVSRAHRRQPALTDRS